MVKTWKGAVVATLSGLAFITATTWALYEARRADKHGEVLKTYGLPYGQQLKKANRFLDDYKKLARVYSDQEAKCGEEVDKAKQDLQGVLETFPLVKEKEQVNYAKNYVLPASSRFTKAVQCIRLVGKTYQRLETLGNQTQQEIQIAKNLYTMLKKEAGKVNPSSE